MSAPPRTLRYRTIADDLRIRLGDGDFTGGLLPSEADLTAHYEASRVTVRKALELLRDEGRVDSRQGFGWFVAVDLLRQTLSRLGTIEEQLAASGVANERRIVSFAFAEPPAWVAEHLGTGEVLTVRRCNLADGDPFARVTVWCPAELAAELSRGDVERRPFMDLLDVEAGGARQTIGAGAAEAADARMLQIPEGSPVLRAERITHDSAGTVVLVSEHIFPGHRTEFVVDLPVADMSATPTGLRLLD
ncbi:MAG: GntR family transcriptional regulator [Candidatus Poriferisodalaceae bacterium]